MLGIHFNAMHTFTSHINKTATKAKKKLNVLKALAGTDWGQDKQTLVNTYKSIIRPVLEYGSPIWSPIISDSNWGKLQRVQNSALKICTGSYHGAGYQHVHRETKVLPLREHGKMLTQQYLAATFLPGHPGREHLDRPPPPRSRKPTMQTYKKDVEPCFTTPADDMAYKSAIKTIHTTAVDETLRSYPNNRVLGRNPPPLNEKEESDLNRKARSALSQLRSGFCKILNNYNNRCDNNVPDICPKCSQSPHDTNHLFNCPQDPTILTVESLWLKPKMAAEFLKLEQEQEPRQPP